MLMLRLCNNRRLSNNCDDLALEILTHTAQSFAYALLSGSGDTFLLILAASIPLIV
jgi:hypothetical protein